MLGLSSTQFYGVLPWFRLSTGLEIGAWFFPLFTKIFQSNKQLEVFSLILKNILMQEEMETNTLCSISTKFLIKNKVGLLDSIV